MAAAHCKLISFDMHITDTLECDLLVLGSGMAGLSAAACAAEAGKKVVVVEKSETIGGSAILSGGYVWTVPTREKLAYVGNGSPALGAVLIDGYADAIAWLRTRGVHLSSPCDVMYGRGYQIDIVGHLNSCVSSVEHADGLVVRGTTVDSLVMEGGRVVGADTVHPDGVVRVRANHTLLATGGFQADPELRAHHVHPNARSMLLRSNPCSVGDGLRLAQAVGGAMSPSGNTGFYGHLLCEPAVLDHPSKFSLLTQYHSEVSVLLNREGQRFCDESLGDHLNAQETLCQDGATALLVWDQDIEEQHVMRPFVAGIPPVDKFALAVAQGARAAICASVEDVAQSAQSWGFNGAALRATLERFNSDVQHAPERLMPPRTTALVPVARTPLRVMVVQSAITFTHGGVSVDAYARVLDNQRRPVPGLLAAGADVADVFRRGYAGGLALALTFGLHAARYACAH